MIMDLYLTETKYIIQLTDFLNETRQYKGWSFNTITEANDRVAQLFEEDPSLKEAKIFRVEKTPVKQIINNDAWQMVVD